jgi:hypothetical protein
MCGDTSAAAMRSNRYLSSALSSCPIGVRVAKMI